MRIDQYQGLKACKKIGLFDSGLGGLSVLRKLTNLSSQSASGFPREMSAERLFVYLGDTARFPYGNRSKAEVTSFVSEIIHWLVLQGVDGIVIACNTSTALALETAQQISPVPIFDIIGPTAARIARLGKKVGVLSTASTSASRAYSKAVKAINPAIEVVEIGCPDLVPLVENGKIFDPLTKSALKPYVDRLLLENVSALVLGCTHFPFLAQPLKELVDGRMAIIDPAEVLSSLLEATDYSARQRDEHSDNYNIFVTGDCSQFEQAAALCLGRPVYTTGSVTIKELAAPIAGEKMDERVPISASTGDMKISTNVTSENLVALSSAGGS